MKKRPVWWLAAAFAVVAIGQAVPVQARDAAATEFTRDLSAAQNKKQAAAPQRRSNPAPKATRSQAAKPVRSQPARTHTAKPVRTQTAKPVRTTPKATARTTPKTKAASPATTRRTTKTVTPVTKQQQHINRATSKTTTRHVTTKTGPSRHFTATKPITRGPGAVKRGPGAVTRRHIAPGPGVNRQLAQRRYWNGWRRPARVVVVRDRWRYWGPNGWRTYVPFAALATFAIGAATFYPAGYVSMPEVACAGVTADGNQLRWVEVPLEEGGSDWQCVAYSPEPNRVITELDLPDQEPVGSVPAPTVGAAPPVAAPTPAVQAVEQARGCELVIYSDANFSGTSAPTDEDQADLGAEGWKDQIASVQVKSGTWDFFTGENYSGEMMRLGPGSYTALDPKWTRRIGSFMCSRPAGA